MAIFLTVYVPVGFIVGGLSYLLVISFRREDPTAVQARASEELQAMRRDLARVDADDAARRRRR